MLKMEPKVKPMLIMIIVKVTSFILLDFIERNRN
jgi:hypothetical protein